MWHEEDVDDPLQLLVVVNYLVYGRRISLSYPFQWNICEWDCIYIIKYYHGIDGQEGGGGCGMSIGEVIKIVLQIPDSWITVTQLITFSCSPHLCNRPSDDQPIRGDDASICLEYSGEELVWWHPTKLIKYICQHQRISNSLLLRLVINSTLCRLMQRFCRHTHHHQHQHISSTSYHNSSSSWTFSWINTDELLLFVTPRLTDMTWHDRVTVLFNFIDVFKWVRLSWFCCCIICLSLSLLDCKDASNGSS